MTNADYLKLGSYNFCCDRCGKKYKREDGRKEWTGLLVCNRCWEPKHPWLVPLPAVIDGLPVPDARPIPKTSTINLPLPTLSIWGVQYQRLNGAVYSDIACKDWDEVIGGSGTIEFNATNFPLV